MFQQSSPIKQALILFFFAFITMSVMTAFCSLSRASEEFEDPCGGGALERMIQFIEREDARIVVAVDRSLRNIKHVDPTWISQVKSGRPSPSAALDARFDGSALSVDELVRYRALVLRRIQGFAHRSAPTPIASTDSSAMIARVQLYLDQRAELSMWRDDLQEGCGSATVPTLASAPTAR